MGSMEKNVQTIPDIDPRFLSAEANANGPTVVKELTAQEEARILVRADAASHSQFDR
jgi:hypothetical protein